jgi:hypothetical protein
MKWSFLFFGLLLLGCTDKHMPKMKIDLSNIPAQDSLSIDQFGIRDTMVILKTKDGLKIGRIFFIDICFGKIVLYDPMNNSIICFDIFGNHIGTINKSSGTVNNFASCDGIQITCSNEFAIIDRQQKRIITFSLLTGKTIDSIGFKTSPRSFYLEKGKKITLFSPYPLNYYANSYQIQAIDLANKQETYTFFRLASNSSLLGPIFNVY